MSFIFLRNRVTGGAAFSPASLFASGEEGAWYEPSTTTAFLSTTDLTPCGVGDACGFLLDLSKGAGYSGGSFTGLGSELVTNGTFDTDVSGWTDEGAAITLSHDAANQRMQVVTTSHLSNGFYQDITTVAGAGYFVSIDATRSDINTRAYNGGSFLNAINVGGTDTLYFIAESTTTRIYFRCPVALATYFVDNISVRELPGNHATQTNPDPQPLLQQTAGGLYYLDFDGSDDGMTVGTTSTFNFVHNGAGAEILAAVTPSDVANPNAFYAFLSNNDGGAANIGFTIAFDDRASQSRNEALFLQVARGVLNQPTFAAVTTDTITNFTSPTVFRFGYKEAESPEYFFNENQVSVYSGNSTNAPSASDATSALSIGIFSNGTQNWNGKFFGLIMIDRFLTTGEASDTETYLAAKSGVTL